MQILKISYEFPPIGGGGSKVVCGLSRVLVEKGHEVDLVTMSFHGLPRFEKIDGVNVYRIPCFRRNESICHPHEMATYLVAAVPFINKLIRKKRYNINHTHFIFPDGLLSANLKRLGGPPFIITAHGSDVPGYNPNRFRNWHKVLRPLWKKVVNSAEMIISPSQSLADLVALEQPSTPVEVIPNGIDIIDYDLSTRNKDSILVVSRFFERKGIQYFLQALEGLDKSFKIDIVGAGPYLAELKSIAGKLHSNTEITFHGWVDHKSPQMRELFEQASIFVLPSEAENFPIVLLEAMVASLAIITTRGTGCEEVVGEAALLVPPKDSSAIRKALSQLSMDDQLRDKLANAARERVSKLFDWSVVADQYIEIYERVITSQ